MANRPKNIGTAAETAVVRAARRHGFPHADRLTLTGSQDRGDVGLCPGVILEVKGGEAARRASDQLIATWLAETERERINAGAHLAFLVTQRPGIGAPNAHRWWAHMTLTTLLHLADGYDYDRGPTGRIPLRMTLDSALALLRDAGYGQAMDVDIDVDVQVVGRAREGAAT